MPIPDCTGESGQSGWVPILLIDLQTVFFADSIQIIDPCAVLLIGPCIHLNNGMDAFSCGVNHAGHGKLQLPDDSFLLSNVCIVRLHQCIAESRNVLILDALAIQWIEADPRADARIIVSKHGAEVILAALQSFNELSGRPIIISLCRDTLAFFVLEGFSDISNEIIRGEQSVDVSDEVLSRVPHIIGRLVDVLGFQPRLIHYDMIFRRVADF